ncbi:MAG: hypothetical protein O2854_05735 [Chloroflexi bacterium]|nr:hypothetical protein [Chloroflexota bacterium]
MTASPLKGKVQTVLGPVAPSGLGITMMHEHLVLDITCYIQQAEEASNRSYRDKPVSMDWLGNFNALFSYNMENMRLLDEKAAVEEVLKFKYAGGGTVVDTTSRNIGRDPLAQARISRATGLNVVMGGSYYVAIAHPAEIERMNEKEIAEVIIRDVTVGVGDTGVKSGIIGEVGCSWPRHPNERKVLRASGMAQKETGAPITIHSTGPEESRLQTIEDLVKGGADPKHVVMGHLDSFLTDKQAFKRLAETGCYLEIDVFGWESSALGARLPGVTWTTDVQRMEALESVIEAGHLDQIVIAQDVCQKWMYTRYGGKGFAHLLENIVPRMRKRGWTQAQLDTILVKNPAKALTFS